MSNMNIWHISDLHLSPQQIQQSFTYGSIPKADLAVIVGDISDDIDLSLQWCRDVVRPLMPVIYVPGNHDFYFTDLLATSARARQTARRYGIHYLDGDCVDIEGVRFIGATFWSDLELDTKTNDGVCEHRLSDNLKRARNGIDYKRIYVDRKSAKFVTPEFTRAIHFRQKEYIKRVLERDHYGPKIVLTHYAIHENSVNPLYRHTPTAHCYISCQESLIERYRPTAWLHGHVHDRFEYRLHDTQISCNPGGYAHEANNGFEWSLVHSV